MMQFVEKVPVVESQILILKSLTAVMSHLSSRLHVTIVTLSLGSSAGL